MTDKCINKHMSRVINSLQHPYLMGRLCSIRLLGAIIVKFPKKMIDVYGMVIYVSIVQQIGNETDSIGKKRLISLLKRFLQQIEYNQFWQMFVMLEEWIKGNNLRLKIAALQAGRAFIEQKSHLFRTSDLKQFLKTIYYHINEASKVHKSFIKSSDYGSLGNIWKPCYLSLILFEKLLKLLLEIGYVCS